MGYSDEQLNDIRTQHYSVMLFDKSDGLADRNAHFDAHKSRLAQFKQQHPGVIGM